MQPAENNKTGTGWIRAQYFPLDLNFIDEPYASPDRMAVVATKKNLTYDNATKYIKSLTANRRNNNPVLKALDKIVDRTVNAARVCSSITVVNFRHLMAEGWTLHDIADAVDLNVLDLMAYMAHHPEADQFAELDMTACADAKMRNLLLEMEDAKMESKYESDRQKNKLYATELLLKRLSSKWVAQSRATSENIAESTAGMTVNMQIGQINAGNAQVTNNSQNNYSPEQQEAAEMLATYQANMKAREDEVLSLEYAQEAVDATETADTTWVEGFTSPEALAQSRKEAAEEIQGQRLRHKGRQERRDSSSEYKPVVTERGYDKHTGD